MFVFPAGTFNFFIILLKMHISVMPVFQSERVLNIFNMVISGMKTQIQTSNLFYSVKKTNIRYFNPFRLTDPSHLTDPFRLMDPLRLTDPFRR